MKYSQIYVAVDQRYVAHERRRPAQKIVQTLVEYDQQSDYVSEKERNEGREIPKNLRDPSIQSNKKEPDNRSGRRGVIDARRLATKLLKNGLCVYLP